MIQIIGEYMRKFCSQRNDLLKNETGNKNKKLYLKLTVLRVLEKAGPDKWSALHKILFEEVSYIHMI